MKHAPIFVVLGAGALLGWFSPDVPDNPNTGVDTRLTGEASGQEERLAKLQYDEWAAGEVILPRAGDGHFYADVTVDSGSALMLVDTGASMIALTGEDADAMGVIWSQDEVRPVAKGASGTVLGVPVMLDRVQLGEFEAQQVEAVVIPEGLEISLLGQSFLSKIQRVEIEQDRMVLGG